MYVPQNFYFLHQTLKKLFHCLAQIDFIIELHCIFSVNVAYILSNSFVYPLSHFDGLRQERRQINKSGQILSLLPHSAECAFTSQKAGEADNKKIPVVSDSRRTSLGFDIVHLLPFSLILGPFNYYM